MSMISKATRERSGALPCRSSFWLEFVAIGRWDAVISNRRYIPFTTECTEDPEKTEVFLLDFLPQLRALRGERFRETLACGSRYFTVMREAIWSYSLEVTSRRSMRSCVLLYGRFATMRAAVSPLIPGKLLSCPSLAELMSRGSSLEGRRRPSRMPSATALASFLNWDVALAVCCRTCSGLCGCELHAEHPARNRTPPNAAVAAER